MPDAPRRCWVISDGRRGIENQALGLAEAAGRLRPLDITTHKIKSGKAFEAARPAMQFTLKSKPSDYGLGSPLPDIAIGCGRQAIAPLLAIKKMSPDIFTIYVQNPRIDPSRFDLVIAPEHDNLSGPNVEMMIGSPNRVTETQVIGEMLNFADGLSKLPMPRAAMLIGGHSKTHKLSKADHADHLEAAHALLAGGHSLLVTTSRRTPDFAIEDYKRLDSDHSAVWAHTGDGPNPYFAFLGGADIILVSKDSTNMLTEAASTGKPVFMLPMQGKAGKFQRLYDRLAERCHVTPFAGTTDTIPYEPLGETSRMAGRLWAHFEARNAVRN